MKSMVFCLLGAAAGTVGLMAFDTAALSRPDNAGAYTSSHVASEAGRQLSTGGTEGAGETRKVRVVYPMR
jgi:hypothetical protein